VVVEAAVDGGALITARLALEMGRDVLAVPGDIDRPVSMGCNLLIRDGAHPVLGIDDLVELLSFSLGPPANTASTHAVLHSFEDAVTQSDAPVGETLAALIQRQLRS
jgi:predicted Rossmann fold nucleotide-binding protein DprA/Smf involved in DNA uptake